MNNYSARMYHGGSPVKSGFSSSSGGGSGSGILQKIGICEVRLSSTFPLGGSSVLTKIGFDSIVRDDLGLFDVVNNRLVAAEDKTFINANCFCSCTLGIGGTFEINWIVNGDTLNPIGRGQQERTFAATVRANSSTVANLMAGDGIEIWAYQDTAFASNVEAGSNSELDFLCGVTS